MRAVEDVVKKIVRGLVFVIVGGLVFGFLTKELWNWLMPSIFGLRMVTFWQAIGLVLLGKILFGGFHKHAPGRRGWKRHMEERWAKMTPEERERFRAGMRGRGCGFGREERAAQEAEGRL